MARIYTRTGDDGFTYCFLLGRRVPKDHPLIEFMGALDEANSAVGLAASLVEDEEVAGFLRELQRILFNVGFHLSGARRLDESVVEWLERSTDKFMEGFEFRGFILPGGTPGSAAIHLARSMVRRAERRLVAAMREHGFEGRASIALKVLNRASDALFAAAVREAMRSGAIEFV